MMSKNQMNISRIFLKEKSQLSMKDKLLMEKLMELEDYLWKNKGTKDNLKMICHTGMARI